LSSTGSGAEKKCSQNHTLAIFRHVIPVRSWEIKGPRLYLRKKSGVILVIERRKTAQKDVENDAQAPTVYFLRVRARFEDLRSCMKKHARKFGKKSWAHITVIYTPT
jgi:hypothetical protein